MQVQVWSADWEISCCQPDAAVSEHWSVPVVFSEGAQPWFRTQLPAADADVSQDALGLTTLENVKELRRSQQSDFVLADSNGLTFCLRTTHLTSPLVGRFHVDGHRGDLDIEIPNLSGTVTRVQLVPVENHRRSGTLYEPRRWLEPIEATSTRQRHKIEQGDQVDSGTQPATLLSVALLATVAID